MKTKQRSESSRVPRGDEERIALHKKRRRRLVFIKILVIIVFFTFIGSAYAEAPTIRSFVARITTPKPKPLIQSSTKLSPTTQQAIKGLAEQEIRDAKAQALVANTSGGGNADGAAADQSVTTENPSVLQSIKETIQEATTTDPVAKAKLRLERIDGLIAQLQNLLASDKSDAAIRKAVTLLQKIGERTGAVATDPAVQTDRDVLKLQIEQYNRLQLILQRVEDQLPIQGYLKIEEARLTYLVRGAQESINAAPNLEVVHNIALKEIAKVVGDDFADLKAIEVLTDIGSGLQPEAKEKLEGLQKQIALDFEKRMLKLAPNVRNRKLQDYVTFSYGNPLRQAEAFEHMKDFLTDRDLILGVESLKELSLKRLEERVFSIADQDTLNQFLDGAFKTPDQLKILAQMKLDVLGGQDEGRKQRLAQLEADAQDKIVETFGTKEKLEAYFAQAEHQHGDVLDAITLIQLADMLDKSPEVSAEAKATITGIKQKTLQNFVANVRESGFATVAKVGYSPVGEAADVRLLLPAPQTLTLLATIRNELADKDKAVIARVERANSVLVAEHLLSQVHDVGIFEQYQTFITNTPQAKQLLQSHVGGRVLSTIAKKEKVVAGEAQTQEQALYEKMQQVTQRIFANNSKTDLERQFSTGVQQEIAALKADLPSHNIPQLETPAGVKLSEVAVLPSEVQEAIIQAAKQRIKKSDKPADQLAKELAKQAKDLGVSIPSVLPGNPLYAAKKAARLISLAVRTNTISQARELLKQDNEKTVEAAQLLIDTPSQKSIELALETLESVAKDFATIKENTSKLTDVGSNQTAQIDALVDQMIDNGLSRQAVISLIENQVHGDAYVAVEVIRSDLLKDGVDILLEVTNGDVAKLTETLQKTVATEPTNQLEGIKAVELLNEIARSQPEDIQTILQTAETEIASKVEETLLAMPEEQRVETVLNYAEDQTGNPVRQFEAYEILENNFTNPDTILLTEGLKDQATENLEERISEIPDANTQQEFIDTVIGSEPQDLKVITEIELRVQAPVETAGIAETPIQTQIADIKSNIEQQIIDTYKDNPEALKEADFFDNPTLAENPDVVDVEVVRELTEVLERSPDVQPEVVQIAEEASQQIISTFITNVSQPDEVVAQTLNPIPETLALLVELKSEVSVAQQASIDVAINAQVELMQEYLTTEVPDPQIFQMYVIQITENPEIAQAVAAAGGTDFIQAIEEKAQEIQVTATEDQAALQTVVEQIQEEIFSAPVSVPSTTEQTLSPAIQEEIQEIKHEVPVEQIPAVTVTVEVTTTPTTIEEIQSTPEPVEPVVTTVSESTSEPTIEEPAPVQAPAAPAPAPVGL